MDRSLQSTRSRSAVASRSDRSSALGFVSPNPDSREGSTQTQRQRNLPNLGSDYRSRTTKIPVPADAMLSSKRSRSLPGTPIKKLLAEEMFKESDSKRCQPGLVARLMGFDGLPAQQPSQQKIFTVNSQHSTALMESHRNAISYDGYHRRNISKEQKEFKDVFEVTEMPRVQSGRVPLQRTESARVGDGRREFIQKKFIDAKRLDTDRRLWDSMESHDRLDLLNSSTDHLVTFLPETNSMHTNDRHNMKDDPSQSLYSHIAVIRPTNALKHEKKAKGSKQGRHSTWKSENSSSLKHLDGSQSNRLHDVHISLKSKAQLERNDELQSLPTRIVVLKPNIGKSLKAAKPVFPPHSSHAFLSDNEKREEFSGIRLREGELWEKENLCDDMGSLRNKSRESREIAKEITRQVRNGLTGSSINFSTSFRRGYAGDESSCSMSEYDCPNESDATTSTSRYSFDCDYPYEPSSSHSTICSVKRDAKNRLSERCKMNKKFLDVGMNGNSSTLGEMLSVPDRKALKKNLDVVIAQEDWIGSGGITGKDGPFGISSRDGWRNGGIGNLSRSRSLPTSSTTFGRRRASRGYENTGDDIKTTPKEILNKGRNKAVEVNYDGQEGSSFRNSIAGNKKSQAPPQSFRESNDSLLHSYYSQNRVLDDFKDKVTSKCKPMVPEKSSSNVRDVGPDPDDELDKRHENLTVPFKFPDNMIQETSDSLVVKALPSGGVEDVVPQEPESPASSKDTDQPSPVSVLEVPFVEDPSSGCECFERVSADLQGLRMQLQLLKLESESYEEGPMLISSDEDDGVCSEGKAIPRTPESWQYSYLVDVLNQCGFDDTDPDMFMASWNSSDRPISPLVFENLENKYCDKSSCSKNERKLLFDWINLGIIEIFELFLDQRPWVKPMPVKVLPKRGKVDLERELWKLLERTELMGYVAAEEMLGKEWQWLNLGNDFDVIGSEVERLLIDQLVLEVVVA